MSRKQYPQLTEMAKARLAPCVADIFCLCSGFRGRDEDGLGERGSMQGQPHPESPRRRTCLPLLRVLWRDDGQTAGARLLMRAKLAHRDSQLTAKVTVVARAYSEISERNVVPRQMKMMRCHAIRFQKDRGEN